MSLQKRITVNCWPSQSAHRASRHRVSKSYCVETADLRAVTKIYSSLSQVVDQSEGCLLSDHNCLLLDQRSSLRQNGCSQTRVSHDNREGFRVDDVVRHTCHLRNRRVQLNLVDTVVHRIRCLHSKAWSGGRQVWHNERR